MLAGSHLGHLIELGLIGINFVGFIGWFLVLESRGGCRCHATSYLSDFLDRLDTPRYHTLLWAHYLGQLRRYG